MNVAGDMASVDTEATVVRERFRTRLQRGRPDPKYGRDYRIGTGRPSLESGSDFRDIRYEHKASQG